MGDVLRSIKGCLLYSMSRDGDPHGLKELVVDAADAVPALTLRHALGLSLFVRLPVTEKEEESRS